MVIMVSNYQLSSETHGIDYCEAKYHDIDGYAVNCPSLVCIHHSLCWPLTYHDTVKPCMTALQLFYCCMDG